MVYPTPVEIRSFFNNLIELTEKELAYEETESNLLFSNASFSELEKAGLAIGNLSAANVSIGLGGKTIVACEMASAYTTTGRLPIQNSFRSGDIVILKDHSVKEVKGSSSSGKDKAVELNGVVVNVGDTKIVIALSKDDLADDIEIPERIRVLKVANPTTYTRQISTLKSVLRSILPKEDSEIHTPSPLLSVLLGLQSPTFSPIDPTSTPIKYFDSNLNLVQKNVVEWCLRSSQEISLIFGPPGTGKTQTLIEIIRQLVVVENKRVLVCGGSNLSVDNILLRLKAPSSTISCPTIPCTRLGHPARVLEVLIPYTLDSQSLRTNASELLLDIKSEMEVLENQLILTNTSKTKRIKGKERKDKVNEKRELRKEYRKREGGVIKEVLSNSRVVIATLHGAGSKILEKEEFDVVIIDEAAQALEPSCWIGLLKAKKLILAGDPNQLPPTIKSTKSKSNSTTSTLKIKKGKESTVKSTALDDLSLSSIDLTSDSSIPTTPSTNSIPPTTSTNSKKSTYPLPLLPSKSLEVTLFSRLLSLHGPSISKMLTIQYRFNSKICSFPSSSLYNNELIAAESVNDRQLSDLIPEIDRLEGWDEGIDESVVFIDTAGTGCFERNGLAGGSDKGKESTGNSLCNENEATLVINYIDYLIKAGIPSSFISIISPYSSQVALLTSLLLNSYPSIEVSSIDGYQGRESEIIIISLVRSNEKGQVGFLSEMRRLNVAMTRARSQLVVVGDSETVGKGSKYLKSWIEWLEENGDVRMAEI